LTIANHRIRIIASDLTGLRCAIVTLVQLFSLFYPKILDHQDNLDESSEDIEDDEHGITSVAISDSPDFPMRAVLLDLNPYGRVPKMEVLLGMMDVWSLIKINQFHAFFRVGASDASFMCYTKRYVSKINIKIKYFK
jgi:hypothetical protein